MRTVINTIIISWEGGREREKQDRQWVSRKYVSSLTSENNKTIYVGFFFLLKTKKMWVIRYEEVNLIGYSWKISWFFNWHIHAGHTRIKLDWILHPHKNLKNNCKMTYTTISYRTLYENHIHTWKILINIIKLEWKEFTLVLLFEKWNPTPLHEQ